MCHESRLEWLTVDRAKAEDNLTVTEAELEKQNKVVSDLSKTVCFRTDQFFLCRR